MLYSHVVEKSQFPDYSLLQVLIIVHYKWNTSSRTLVPITFIYYCDGPLYYIRTRRLLKFARQWREGIIMSVKCTYDARVLFCLLTSSPSAFISLAGAFLFSSSSYLGPDADQSLSDVIQWRSSSSNSSRRLVPQRRCKRRRLSPTGSTFPSEQLADHPTKRPSMQWKCFSVNQASSSYTVPWRGGTLALYSVLTLSSHRRDWCRFP